MQPFNEIEESYKTPDPWGYQTNPDDQHRKQRIISLAKEFGPYERAMDLGAGEGWITKDLPAKEIWGYEVSNNAAARFPENVKRVVAPEGKYDLIVATGIFYGHYNWPFFMQMIKNHAGKHVLVSSIKTWEHECVNTIGKELAHVEFGYREFIQRLRIFQVPE